MRLTTTHEERRFQIVRFSTALTLSLLAMLVISSLFVGHAIAQTTTAEVVGTVHDETGSLVPNAEVTIINRGTNETRKATSGSDGTFTFNLLPPGSYSITVTAASFKRYEVPNITLAVGDRPRIDAALSVGAVNETVSVEATTPLLQSENSTLQSNVNQQAVQDLPLNGRNFVQLVQLVPGANEGPPGSLTNGTKPDDKRQSAAFSANGQSEVLNNQMIDGMDNNEGLIGSVGVRPSVDAISEIRVQTNVYSADTGRTGGAAVNIITKAGTNHFHGTAYEYFRNDVFNSYPFQFGAHNPKQELRQNQFGASIGGPIFKNKTFFFGDYEGFRLVQGANPTVSTIPTLFEEQNPGNFSDQPAPNNIVLPSSSLDSAALNYLKLFPAPNLPNIQSNGLIQGQYVGVAVNTQFSHVFDIRLDHQINDHNSIFGRYSYNNVKTWGPSTFPVIPVAGVSVMATTAGAGYSPSVDHNISLSYTHTFSQSLLLQLQAGFLRVDNETYPTYFGNGNKSGPAVNTAYGMPGVNVDAFTSGLAHVGWSNGYTALGGGAFTPLTDLTNAYQYQGTVTYTRGAHNIKMGSALIRRQLYSVQSAAGLPQWTFANFPQFEQGIFTQVTRTLELVNPHYERWEPNVYIQDDWHVSSNTTLNLGVRYDVFTPFTEVHNQISTWNPMTEVIQVAGVNGVSPTAGIRTVYTNVAPRIGFATTLRPGLVLRGGFGMSYYPTSITSNAAPKNQPFVSTYGPFSSANAAQLGYAGFSRLINGAPPIVASSATNPTGSIRQATDPNYRPAVAEQFNLAVQKDFRGNVLTISYVGVLTRHIPQTFNDYNEPPPNTVGFNTLNGVPVLSGGTPCNPATDPHQCNPNVLRPVYSKYPGLTSIGWMASGGVGNYHALQVSFERRLSRGLSFTSNYTYARNIDNASGLSNEDAAGSGVIISQSHIYDYGNSDLDLRNRGVATLNYTLPFASSKTGLVGAVAKGWQVNVLGAWSAGQPFTPINSSNITNTNPGGGGDRPNRDSSQPVTGDRSLKHFFNTAAFTTQTLGTVGNSSRNSVYGPHFRHVDLSFIKSFPIYDAAHLEFRAEGFNITNTANFSVPNLTVGLPNFGQISSMSPAYAPRVIQFALKLIY